MSFFQRKPILPTTLIITVALSKPWWKTTEQNGGSIKQSHLYTLDSFKCQELGVCARNYNLNILQRIFFLLFIRESKIALHLLRRLVSSLQWAVHLIRWKQTNEMGYLPNEKMPNTFMAVTHDLYGVKGDAHEKEKQPWVRRIIPGTVMNIYQEYR